MTYRETHPHRGGNVKGFQSVALNLDKALLWGPASPEGPPVFALGGPFPVPPQGCTWFSHLHPHPNWGEPEPRGSISVPRSQEGQEKLSLLCYTSPPPHTPSPRMQLSEVVDGDHRG